MSIPEPQIDPPRIAPTGSPGLDDILGGGFTRNRLYVVEGVPGAGKTTLGLQFALDGVRRGESALYVTLSESQEELEAVAASHGWSLQGLHVHELVPDEETLQPTEHYTVFHPAEVELGQTTDSILQAVDRLKPSRVVIDSLSEMRLLAAGALRYRRQILALKQFFRGRGCTVLLLDDLTAVERDLQVQSIANGVLMLDQLRPEYGTDRRRLHVVKHRGRSYRGGYHDYRIRRGGLEVFPRLVAAEHRQIGSIENMATGIAELDQLLGGGIGRGTSTLIVGAAGTGKSSLAARMVVSAAERGEPSAMYIFDEALATLRARSSALGIDLGPHLESGVVTIQQVDPAELSPGELAHSIRKAVDERAIKLVVIDSLNGFLNAMPEERYLILHLRELLMYLSEQGVATLLLSAHHGLIGSDMRTPVDASYLADSVILMRYFESAGLVRQAISVVKKRGGNHERSIREFTTENGLAVGPTLTGFRGILSGAPAPDALVPGSHE